MASPISDLGVCAIVHMMTSRNDHCSYRDEDTALLSGLTFQTPYMEYRCT